jgi:hypothetical protein
MENRRKMVERKPKPEPEPQVSCDQVDCEVWNYESQEFIRSFRVPGEKRVRVDYFGDLSDLDVFEVRRDPVDPRVFYPLDGNKPLAGWVISLS